MVFFLNERQGLAAPGSKRGVRGEEGSERERRGRKPGWGGKETQTLWLNPVAVEAGRKGRPRAQGESENERRNGVVASDTRSAAQENTDFSLYNL